MQRENQTKSVSQLMGERKYAFLRSFSERLPDTGRNQTNTAKQAQIAEQSVQQQKMAAYYRKLHEPLRQKVYAVTADRLHKAFKRKFSEMYGVDFQETAHATNNLEALAYYFSRDERFTLCESLKTTFDFEGQQKKSAPSLNKGLLIMGGYGSGKTSMMRVFENLLQKTNHNFIGHTANEIVESYEVLESPLRQKQFWLRMNRGTRCFDDVKTERIASHYGKVNLFKDILEKRYNQGMTTYITCNYDADHPHDFQAGLAEFGKLYGGRLFDRIFELFNLVEFKDMSFRR